MAKPLKQRTLSFASTKRTASTSAAKGKKALRSLSASTSTADRAESVETISVISTSPSESEDADDIVEDANIDVQRPLKKLKIDDGFFEAEMRTNRGKGRKSMSAAATKVQSDESMHSGISHGDLDMMDKAGKWKSHYAGVRAKMGHLKPIHGQGQTKVHEILRVFDLSYEYGPCVGVTRLERWERAEALGLNPPLEVREILRTKRATKSTELSQSVFYDFGV